MKVYVVLESLWDEPEVLIAVCSSREKASAIVREARGAFLRNWPTTTPGPEYRIEAVDLDVYRYAD